MSIKFDNRMPQPLHAALCAHIMREMNPGECDHTLRHTNRFLDAFVIYTGDETGDDARQWLAEHGGHCDCEVITNTVPWDEIKNTENASEPSQ